MPIIIGFFIVLGVIVLAHELGHFFAARSFAIKVHEFGIGMAPRICGVYKNENNKRKFIWGNKQKAEELPNTLYSINWLPIGGFVSIKGEGGENQQDHDSLAAKKAWQKSIVLSAGVLANFLLCIILLSIGYAFGTPTVIDSTNLNHVKLITDKQIQVVSVNSGSPAETAGIKVGDAVLELDGQPVATIEQIQKHTAQKENLLVNIKVKRGESQIDLEVIPRVLKTSNNQAVIGTGLATTAIVSYKWYEAIWQGIKSTGYLIVAICVAFWQLLKDIFISGEVSADIGGPIAIAVITGQAIKLGWLYLLQFMALLTVNLGIINILPIPALDGARLVFVLIEKIRGKQINKHVENTIHAVGFMVLLLLLALVTYRDILRWGGQIVNNFT